jgi:hypothetical protein
MQLSIPLRWSYLVNPYVFLDVTVAKIKGIVAIPEVGETYSA